MIENNNVAVLFRGVSKTYRLTKSDKGRFQSFFTKSKKFKTRDAVKNVSFLIEKGESVALLGRNGAGKSTIMKMMAGVVYPSKGLVRVNGRVSALLELSAGFDTELTGRENIYFRGEIMGVSRKMLKEMESEIIEFAELGEYINQPVRTYSSGMRARLGFAISANVQPEVIIVDEALSVGDKSFREKCNKKIKEILTDGVTFLFVTHSAVEAKRMCKRGIVLDSGQVMFDGDINAAVAFYDNMLKNKTRK